MAGRSSQKKALGTGPVGKQVFHVRHHDVELEAAGARGSAPWMHNNFCRIHRSLRVTPAMEARIADHVWSIDELIGLLP